MGAVIASSMVNPGQDEKEDTLNLHWKSYFIRL